MKKDASVSGVKPAEWFGHPRGLSFLFFTEMWERFSYYGMRSLLVLYMTKYLLIDQSISDTVIGYGGIKSFLTGLYGELSVVGISSHIYGLYTGLVYFTPFFGGIIADRYIGRNNAVVTGSLLMALGHFCMAFESLFFFALVFLILGNGFFKPNISTQVGYLYKPDDGRRDSAYAIFYMGVNLGAFFSPLVCGTLGQKVGWHYGFGAAGVGMLIGLGVYLWSLPYLPAETQTIQKKVDSGKKYDWVMPLIVIGYLCFVTTLFWGVYEQQGNSLQLWADQKTDWNVFGWEMPSSWFQSFNPFFIFFFTPLLLKFWAWQRKNGKEPGSVAKMARGCAWMGAAFILMVYVVNQVAGPEKVAMLWVGLIVFLFTVGELYLSPIGLSMVNKIAPIRMASMFMGIWYFSSFFGNYAAGFIGSYYDRMSNQNFFWLLAGLSLLGTTLFLLPIKQLNKWVKA